jgi:nucleoside-diphosphate kinase
MLCLETTRKNALLLMLSIQTLAAPTATRKVGLLVAAAGAIAGVTTAGSAQNFSSSCEVLPVYGKPGTNQERTFLAVKPDGVQRGLVGDIIARFEKRGYKLVGLKMVSYVLSQSLG